MKRWNWKLIVSCIVFYVLWKAVFALAATTEQLAFEIAQKHNNNPARLADPMTVSSTAKSNGSRVYIKNIMRLKPGLTVTERSQFSEGLRQELIPMMCKSARVVFRAGIAYDLVFESAHGQLAAAFPVAEQDCKALER